MQLLEIHFDGILEERIDRVEAGKIRATSAKVSPNGGLVLNLPRLRGSNLMQKFLAIFGVSFCPKFLALSGLVSCAVPWLRVGRFTVSIFTVVVVKVVGGF